MDELYDNDCANCICCSWDECLPGAEFPCNHETCACWAEA